MNESYCQPLPRNPLSQRDAFISRRRFLVLGAAAAVAGVLPAPMYGNARDLTTAERSLAFYNTHTDERLSTVYWLEGSYVPQSLRDIDYILRDHRTNEVKSIDKRLLDLLFSIRRKLETDQSFHVISGFRSADTNALLRSQSSGIAKNSLHLNGEAIDIRVPGQALSMVRKAAIDLRGGGVGYYPKSDFVHVDVGRVRYW